MTALSHSSVTEEADVLKPFVDRSMDYTRARKILGSEDLFGLEDAINRLRLNPSDRDVVSLLTIPYGERELFAMRDSYYLVAELPVTIVDLRRKFSELFEEKEHWYLPQEFAQDPGIARWRLVRRQLLPGSRALSWDDQCAHVPQGEDVPDPRAQVYVRLAYFLKTGKRFLPRSYSRSGGDPVAGGSIVTVGYENDEKGLSIRYWAPSIARPDIGILTALQ